MGVYVRRLPESDFRGAVDALAWLRILVYEQWPYLYAGDRESERAYLTEYITNPGALVVVAYDDDRIVGVATGSPLRSQKPEFRLPYEQRGMDTGALFYLGENVLLPEYRGKGIDDLIFEERENAAREWGADYACFCAVIREEGHSARPADYVPPDAFWRSRGYEMLPGAVTLWDWEEHDSNAPTSHPMQCWIGAL